ncbi:hypothetical protein M501DRAFT_997926 [Patellaria atrata CBS 101060]|uniref:HTH psq-type domain-containing protein n=1 Tax=Patellaria atrata CBS 101060 TaxID=1346257 RepID=A0A9P4S519_9PEZI|nr:hypothetical protein M501DRAFT_997926 [Patellaria atrata CBS 101060]
MSSQIQESKIILVIEAIQAAKNMSIRTAAKTYNVPRTTLTDRVNGRVARPEKRNARYNLTLNEEEMIIKYVLD